MLWTRIAGRHPFALPLLLMLTACTEPGQTEIARGNLLASQSKFEQAVAAYQAAAKAAPTKARPRELLGHLLFDLGRKEDARAAYEDARRVEPGAALEAEIGLARLDGEAQRFDSALARLNAVLGKHPNNLYALLSKANVEIRRGASGDIEAAIEDTAKAMAMDPKSPSVLYTRGCSFIAAKQYDEARKAFRALEETHPSSPLAWYGNARLASAQGDKVAALASLREAKSRAQGLPGGWHADEVRADPAFRHLSTDPEFESIVASP
jgi:tetratricopeptide (TPR) repeat protein